MKSVRGGGCGREGRGRREGVGREKRGVERREGKEKEARRASNTCSVDESYAINPKAYP